MSFLAASMPAAPAVEPSGLRLQMARSLVPRKAVPHGVEAPSPQGLGLSLIRSLRSPPMAALSLAAPLWILALLAANSAVLVFLGFLTRFARVQTDRRSRRVQERWTPLLHRTMAGDVVIVPFLPPADEMPFVMLWLRLWSSVRGSERDVLVRLARDLGLSRIALSLLRSRSQWKRLLATRLAAALVLRDAVPLLLEEALQIKSRASLIAAAALLQIDVEAGSRVLRQLLTAIDWSPAAVAPMVRNGGEPAVLVLAELLRDAPQGRGKQFVRLIELLDAGGAKSALRTRLSIAADHEEIAALLHALGKLGGREERATILQYVSHPYWLVRMQAATALGHLGLWVDLELLRPMLRDAQWWVRYRAAQALLRLGGAALARSIRDSETDRYARDALERVLAER